MEPIRKRLGSTESIDDLAPLGHRTGLGVAGWLPAVTSSATASRGLLWVTRPSPTSTASAPAEAYRIRSCGPRTPDSAILTTLFGRPGAIRSNTDRSTSRV